MYGYDCMCVCVCVGALMCKREDVPFQILCNIFNTIFERSFLFEILARKVYSSIIFYYCVLHILNFFQLESEKEEYEISRARSRRKEGVLLQMSGIGMCPPKQQIKYRWRLCDCSMVTAAKRKTITTTTTTTTTSTTTTTTTTATTQGN